jgi:DNA polymerase-3 subunit gamma/tau
VPQVTRGPALSAMQYQVLARKWRPQYFHELVGQDHVSRTLLNALQSGRVAHAFLFSGPRGSGKTTTARILAKALNCHLAKPGEPCGQCPACTEIAAGNCMDVLEIDAASNTGVDNVRDLIERIQYRPARDRHKIFIVDEAHMLSTAAFNALLKTLEEPPAHVVFILATTEYHKIPATILSRCQQYSFRLIRFPLILERLKHIARSENVRISDFALEQVAFASGGSMRDAMSALDQVIAFGGETVRDEDAVMLLGLVEPKVLGETVRAIASGDADTILKVVAGQVETGQDLQNFCRRLLGQFRNLMVVKAGVSDTVLLGVPESLLPDLRSQAELFSREDLLRLFDAFLRVEADLRYATQMRFQLEMGLIELSQITRLRPLEEVIAEFTSLAGTDALVRQPGPTARPASAPSQARPAAALPVPPPPSVDRAATGVKPVRAAAPVPPRSETPKPEAAVPAQPTAAQLPEGVHDPRELIMRISAHVRKESLESILQAIPSVELRGGTLILEPGPISDFYRRQIRDNLPVIAQAASEVFGRSVSVQIGGSPAQDMPPAPVSRPEPPEVRKVDVLERAKKEGAVQSFLEVFPGPVKAEEIDQ